jgi:hypothetical protein
MAHLHIIIKGGTDAKIGDVDNGNAFSSEGVTLLVTDRFACLSADPPTFGRGGTSIINVT